MRKFFGVTEKHLKWFQSHFMLMLRKSADPRRRATLTLLTRYTLKLKVYVHDAKNKLQINPSKWKSMIIGFAFNLMNNVSDNNILIPKN